MSPRTLLPVVCLLLLPFGARAAEGLTVTPPGPAVALSPTRGEIVLNGTWNFSAPGQDKLPKTIRVPGSWSAREPATLASGVVAPELTEGVYRRGFVVPSDWAGRRVFLDLRRVSTEADVVVNGKSCGSVAWPYGRVDVTSAVQPGPNNQVEITVRARPPEGETWALMGYATEQRRKRTLASRGLIGDVILESEPMGPRVSDVFVRPSVRQHALNLDVELTDAPAGAWTFTAHLLDDKGREERTFTTTANVTGGAVSTVALSFPWENPRLWDLGQPNLYTLQLEATPPGAAKPADVYPQRFGFREFWIEGRDFVLNGTKIRLRPRGGHGVPATPLEIKAFIEASRGAGFNISQIWPEDALEPGQWNFWELFCEKASEAGWPVIGAAPSFKELVFNKQDGKPIWNANPAARGAFLAAMERELRRYRNYPAILMWGTSGNINNHFADQNPTYLGQKKKLLEVPQNPDGERIAEEAIAAMKKVDPTRPFFVHAGSRLGDVFTVNHYLNILPLQEREEWLSDYVRTGDVPYIGIEFGTPLNTTMNRGRAGFGPSHVSDPFQTEYAAIYLGPEAYALEPRDYRRNLRFGYTGKDWAGDWNQMQWLQSAPETFQRLQALFLRNTWRSWRTAGVTGGMVPWNESNQIFLNRARKDEVAAPPFVPGQRGPAPAKLRAADAAFQRPEGGWEERDAAKALREVNQDTLAWIAGPAPTSADPMAFTAKDHSFRGGEEIGKTAAILNDTRAPQPFRVAWTATVGGTPVGQGVEEGTLAPAETRYLPIRFAAPPVGPGAKMNGEIRLQATIGARRQDDQFAFRVFGAAAARPLPAVQIFDPEGRTKAMLDRLGIPSTTWSGRPGTALLVIGREALSRRHKLPGSLTEFVKSGGRALIFTQAPEFFVDSMGLRVAESVSRRVFPTGQNHPVLAGLDAEDLRDWRSRGTLVPAFPDYDPRAIPTYGWRWGNRAAVSSAPIEKPHNAGWRPILDAEFDLAYSPLLELDFGRGRAVLCTLDLEDAIPADPAADRLARQLVAYAATAPLSPSRRTVFIGNDDDYAFLTAELGLVAERADRLPETAALAVVGADAKLAGPALVNFAKSGGRVVVLAQKDAGAAGKAGGALVLGKAFLGARQPAASAAGRGLGVSELRFRTDLDWPIFEPSKQTDAAGLLHVQEFGRGAVVQAQFEPRWFDVRQIPAMRLTRWRHNRALAQVLANEGAAFAGDTRLLEPRAQSISLAGPWKVKITAPLPNTSWEKPHADPGISAAAQTAVRPDFNDSAWTTWRLPAWYPPLETQNGEVVWRRTVELPPEWEGKILQLGAGRVKSFDTTFWNGEEVGSTDASVMDAWNKPRRYRVPGSLVRGEKVTIAIREFAPDRQGGVHGPPAEMFLRVVGATDEAAPLYNADYRDEFDFGDNPYRYYRW